MKRSQQELLLVKQGRNSENMGGGRNYSKSKGGGRKREREMKIKLSVPLSSLIGWTMHSCHIPTRKI